MLVWHITEDAESLIKLLQDKLSDPKSIRTTDNLHWLASRACITSYFDSNKILIEKDKYNKPSLVVDGMPFMLSITHSLKYAAILISRSYNIAIDMEKFDARIERVKNKFSNLDELGYAKNDNRILTTIWSAKETMYKYYGKKEVDFKTQLLVLPFSHDAKHVVGKIKKENLELDLVIHVLNYGDYILTYIIN
jgi:4'-phosphopantetheinyl transferase